MSKLIMQEEASAPTTPASGKWVAYFKAGGLYIKDDAGTEIGPLGTGGGGSTLAITGCQLIWNSATSLSVGTGVCFAENGDEIDITSVLTASSLSLSSSTWYHVYVYLSSGSPAMEVVTTAPVAWKGTAYSKTSATSRRYIGSVKTDGSGNIYNFKHDVKINLISYKRQQLNGSPFRCLSGGTATTATSVSLAAVVPVTTSLARFRCGTSGDKVCYVGVATLTSTNWQITFARGDVAQQAQILDSPVDASQVIYYLFDSAVGAGSLNIDVYGYIFDR